MKNKTTPFLLLAAVCASLVIVTANAQLTYQDYVLADSPTYYWTWNDGNNNGDNINHGSVGTPALNKVSATQDTVASTSTTGGLSLGNAATFAGPSTNQGWYTATTLSGSGSYSSFAIEFWVNLSDVNQTNRYVIGGGNGQSIIYGFSGNGFEIYNNGPRTGSGLGTIGQGLTSSTWYHLVLAYKDNGASGDVTTLIINDGTGGNTRSTTNLQNYSFNLAIQYEFGMQFAAPGSSNFAGLMDEAAIYDLSSLNQTQYDAALASITSHYSASAVPEPSSIALLCMGGVAFLTYRLRRRNS